MLLLLLACKAPSVTDTPPAPNDDDPCAALQALDALPEPSYTGAPQACDAGTAELAGLENALAHINHARALADLPPLSLDDGQSALAQQVAALMHANGRLSHTPGTDWDCYSPEAAEAAEASLLATAPAIEGVRQYLVDFGNASTLVHRRWLLSQWIDTVGIGSTDEFNAIHLGTEYTDGSGWTVWPPATTVPLPLLRYDRTRTVDTEGWSIQSDTIDLATGVAVVVGPDGELPTTTTVLEPNYGSRQALRIQPEGWRSQEGTYTVELPELELTWDVTFVRCP